MVFKLVDYDDLEEDGDVAFLDDKVFSGVGIEQWPHMLVKHLYKDGWEIAARGWDGSGVLSYEEFGGPDDCVAIMRKWNLEEHTIKECIVINGSVSSDRVCDINDFSPPQLLDSDLKLIPKSWVVPGKAYQDTLSYEPR